MKSKVAGIMSHGKVVPVWSDADNEIVRTEIKKNTPVEDIAKMISVKRSVMAVNIHARELGFKKIPTYASIKRDAEKAKARGKMVKTIAGSVPEKRGVGRPRKHDVVAPVMKDAKVESLLKHILNEQRVGNEITNQMLAVLKASQSIPK